MHIGFILDGNGRWATSRRLPRSYGHKKGAENVETIIRECSQLNISSLTLYAFSTENWKRPVYEVKALMKLFQYYLKKKLTQVHEEDIRVKVIGDITPFPQIIKRYVENLETLTQNNKGLKLNLALNYGGRDEIVRATKKLAKDVLNEVIDVSQICEHTFSKYLDTGDSDFPDLIIRTAGEKRLSNFLLWQSAYSELHFTEKTWPEFNKKDLSKALKIYYQKNRTFGSLEAKKAKIVR